MRPMDQLIDLNSEGRIYICMNIPSPLTGQSSLISLQQTWQHALEKPVELWDWTYRTGSISSG